MTDLLPCPFCGSKAEEDAIGYYHLGNESRHIQCANRECRARPSVCRIQEEEGNFDLGEAWNTRAPQPVSVAQAGKVPASTLHLRHPVEMSNQELAQNLDTYRAKVFHEGDTHDLINTAAQRLRATSAQAGTEFPVEVWNGDRKVSVYDDIVVRLDGPNNGSIGMSEQPRSHESVGEAFKWLFGAAQSSREAQYRVALEKIAGRVPKQKHPAFLRIFCPVCQRKSVEPHTEARHAPNCAAEVARAALALSSTQEKSPVPERPRWPAKGDMMTFLGKNGYPFELEEALKIFTVGESYRVHDCDVGDFRHSIQFDGVKGRYNGVMFELCALTATNGDGAAS